MPRRIVRRVVLERCARPLLARFLAAHADEFFAAHHFSLTALATSEAADRAPIHRLFDLVHMPGLAPALPDAMRAHLEALDSLATPHGGEEILRYDTEHRIPRATYGDESLALIVLLDHPDLAEGARRAASADNVQSFTEYEPLDRRALSFDDAKRDALSRALGIKLEAKGRTRLCHVHVTRGGGVVSLEIVHACRPRTLDKVDVEALALSQSTDVHTERAFVDIDLARGQAAIHASHATKELVRASLGEALAGDAGFFLAARTYDLSPFKALDEALRVEGASPRLRHVEIHDLALVSPMGTTVPFTRARKDLLEDTVVGPELRSLLARCTLVAVKLYLTIEGRAHKLKVAIAVNDKRCRVEFDRDDPEVVDIVRGYLRARRVLLDAPPSELPGKTVAPQTASPEMIRAATA